MTSSRSPLGGRSRVSWVAPVLMLILLALVVAGGAVVRVGRATATSARVATAAATVIRASINPKVAPRKLPASFLGLSIESWNLQDLDSDPLAFERVLKLLSVPRDGGLMLRVGGESTEQTYWDSPGLGTGIPAYRPNGDWMNALADVTRTDHLRLLLDLNLAANSPDMAARFAKAAVSALPAGSLSAFAVGNEPDISHRIRPYPAGTTAPASPSGWDLYTSGSYDAAFRAYARAVRRVAPRVRMAGPEIFFPGRDVQWLKDLLGTNRSRVGMLTVHRYPLSSCAQPSWHDYATVTRVLSQGASGGLAKAMVPAVRVAQRAHLPMRLSEVNSVTCGGNTGVSDTFSTALWAADTLFSMWNDGVSGVNIHIQPTAPNAGFSVAPDGLTTHPLLYGMIMFARSVGPGAKLLGVRTSAAAQSANVKVWAIQGSGGVRKVLVLNKGSQSVNVAVGLPTRRVATVQRLSAPTPISTDGVTLSGQSIGSQGQWVGQKLIEQIAPTHGSGSSGTYTVPVNGYSAALLTVP